jgi:serine/threonine-protein kinase
VGSIVDGKYRIDAVIGRGGMGVVFAALQVDLRREVAIKFLASQGGDDDSDAPEDARVRFRREAQITAQLRGEHIARLLDVGTWQGCSYAVLERLHGADLRGVLRIRGGRLPIGVALDYLLQVCEGLAEAHAIGVVHRDLKPANLFVTHRPDGSDLVKILDFGVSKWRDAEVAAATRVGTVVGSPKYMAPEQLLGGAIDVRADVWALGAVLYEMLAGRPPYECKNVPEYYMAVAAGPPPPLHEVSSGVPSAVSDVVSRCLQREPQLRTPDVAQLAAELLHAVNSPPSDAYRRISVILRGRDSGEAGRFPSTSGPSSASDDPSEADTLRMGARGPLPGAGTGQSATTSAAGSWRQTGSAALRILLVALALAGAGVTVGALWAAATAAPSARQRPQTTSASAPAPLRTGRR